MTRIVLGKEMPDAQRISLPEFENPPVVETVLAVQFEKLTAMQTVHFGLFWRRMQARFPRTEERPALNPMFERFPEPIARIPRMQFESIERPPLPRLWLHSETGTEMIQMQNDRFIKNWRKAGDRDEYPRYEGAIKPAFERDFSEFQSFLAEEKLGPITVNQCEVTYVNHIVSGEGWGSQGDIHRIFTFWKQGMSSVPGSPEDVALQMRFPIRGDRNEPIGRLHVDVQPAFRTTDDQPMYVMNLTARGQYGSGMDFFDIGRRWIVETFDRLTTPEMHRIWGKK